MLTHRTIAHLALPAALVAVTLAPTGEATPTTTTVTLTGATAGTATAQVSGRPDQVFVRDRRNIRPVSGTVVSAELDGVVVEVGGKNRRFAAEDVVRISLHQVPDAFKEGRARVQSGDFENAASAFAAAAEDADSTVVEAAAHLRSAEAQLRLTATDPGRAADAAAAAERFVANYPTHRDYPAARLLLGRAQLLSGSPSNAADTLEALYREAQGSTVPEGYDVEICYRAGLLAAKAALAADDAPRAETLFGSLDSALPGVVADIDPEDPRRNRLETLRGLTQLGEGHTLLARGKATQAKSFFSTRLDLADGTTETVRAATRLGLARALLALESPREAQIEFAGVSATVFGDRDLLGDALVGLAEATIAAGSAGREQARAALEQVKREFGDTLAAPAAHTLLRDL